MLGIDAKIEWKLYKIKYYKVKILAKNTSSMPKMPESANTVL